MHLLTYSLFRIFGFFISLLPYSAIHALGRVTGSVMYLLHRPFRKKALSNLAIAYGESLSEREKKRIARRSFQNLTITCLEFFRLKKSRACLSEIVTFEGGDEILKLMEKKQGIIFLTGHQANWEIPFAAMTARFSGVAIGRPIKNPYLYRWVLSVREMNGGTIIMPKRAIKQGLKALKEGKFLGIVGDQAYPDSPYSYPLFGTRAWTASTPALLAYRTHSPIVVGMTKRVKGKYIVTGSPPLWPDPKKPREEEVPRLMDKAMSYLEKSIQERPQQWLWQHDRWKQQGIDHVKRKYRYGFVLITLPPDPAPYLEILPVFREIYPRSFLTFYVPEGTGIPLSDCEVHPYQTKEDLFKRDWRQQLLLDFYDSPALRRHFRRLGAFRTLYPAKMAKEPSLKQTIQKTLIKKECLPKDFS